jgi:response regulator NasT
LKRIGHRRGDETISMVRKSEQGKPAALRVLLVDETAERAEIVGQALRAAGYNIAGVLLEPMDLLERVEALRPDVIVIGLDSPGRDTMEHVCAVSRSQPRPMVMFSQDDDPSMIRDAVHAGVSAYVVDGMSPERIKPIVEVAIARFEQFQALRDELTETKANLAQRRLIDRAKGVLMKQRGMSEEQAYSAMRKMAMDQNKRIADVAENILTVAELLGKS